MVVRWFQYIEGYKGYCMLKFNKKSLLHLSAKDDFCLYFMNSSVYAKRVFVANKKLNYQAHKMFLACF